MEERISEKLAVVGRIASQTITAGQTKTTDIIDMKYHRRVLFVFNMGAYAAGNNGAVAVKVQASETSNFASGSDITGKVLTAASYTGSANDDCIGLIEVTAEEVAELGPNFRYIRGSIAPTNQNLPAGMEALADFNRYGPADEFDLTAVKEIKA